MFAWFNRISIPLNQPVDILPLVIFRVVFGLLMFFSMIRFMLKGWVSEFYIEPIYHFTYFGFDWIRPLPPTSMYAVFIVLTILSVMIAIGIFYRLSILSFFLLFTYVELIDKTYYLNHYYFVSVVSLLMTTLPLHRKYSVDSYLFPLIRTDYVASWTLLSLRLMLTIVYVYAGIAKLTPDWMLNALPLRIWLPANAEVPIIGWLFDHLWVAYLMSWGGAFYDLTIPFFLLWRRTRPLAYLAVIIFHIMTALLFNIGVFPYVMIASTLIFFDGQDWRWLANKCRINLPPINSSPKRLSAHPLLLTFVALFFAWQFLMPLRHWLYSGNHLWTNEGYRFAWHVMLVEKNGTVLYRIEDPNSDDFWIVYPDAYLTPQQEHQMSFQADMILQFAHFLADEGRRVSRP
ncbi:MAG: HTTM domain-containing protein [Chloroflexota bacterium]